MVKEEKEELSWEEIKERLVKVTTERVTEIVTERVTKEVTKEVREDIIGKLLNLGDIQLSNLTKEELQKLLK